MATINLNPRGEFDHEYVICPYCGEQYGNCWEWVKENANEMICDECGGVFTHHAEHSVAYITRPVSPPQSITIEPNVIDLIVTEELVDGVMDGLGDLACGLGDIAEGIGNAISDALDI